MKYIIFLLLIFSAIDAKETEYEKQEITIGLGPYYQTQPYENVDDIVLASPVIFYDNGIIYIRWSRAGIYFLGESKDDYAWGFSITAQPRVYGYKPSDIEGMSQRENTWEGGLAFSAQVDEAYIEIMALTDILDRYDSYIVKTEIGYDFKFDNIAFYPSLILIYQSSDFLNYYYGVRSDEAITSGYNEYIPNGGLQIGAQTYIKYSFTEKTSALINLRVDRLSKEAAHSPIVNEDFIFSGLASLIYTFEY